ncbi:hypothetical protein L5G28_01415 [Gordonia sp. HY285]|uniref:Transcriptional regulator, AbiEi antitoxin, Type IV TA system n=1 Tax=Gordonia liuliyuniae TaxID=2911517 RepID=A0ABS9IP66_9ACTN|nr:hypothetical protein [Gordonia liuliyuniae]MCF8587354.1 hypothetical protein [Gordonia liuliyuniae]MCF8608823.1 hypothetical protein [Gordonia liuliyuniae]
MRTFPFDEYGVLYRDRAVGVGWTSTQLARAVHAGDLLRIDTGTYAEAVPRPPADLHLLRVRAALERDPGLTFTHQSAAVIHRLPLLTPDLSLIDVVSARRARRRSLRLRAVPLVPEEAIVVDGLSVTSLERTAVSVACTSPMGFAGALTVFDGALSQGASRQSMTRMLDAPMHGVAVARRALALADADSANPAESWSRAQMIEGGLPHPRLQHEFYDANGFVARSDFDWDGVLVAEFDGYGKYEDYNIYGQTPIDVLKREKRRQARLEDLGVDIVRLEWLHLERRLVVPRIKPRLLRLGLI